MSLIYIENRFGAKMPEIFTYEEVVSKSVEYFGGEEFPAKCFADKYALRDNEGNFLENNPDMMHRRLAKEFARIEAKKFKKPLSEDEIYNLFYRYGQIIPQGSPIFAIGNPYQTVSSSNCFVIDSPEDSYAGILHADQQLVQIAKRRGGVGLDLSTLRPTGDTVLNASRTSTGIKSWMSRYSNSTREVGQGGRRGALMLTCSVHHPDVETFITAKNNDKDVTGANISVRLTDEFLDAVGSNKEYELRFPVEDGRVYFKKNAKEIWDKIVHNAWDRAEPGILFWDNIIRESLPDCYSRFGYRSISTNPCGEIILCADDSCRLMAINLFCCVINPFTPQARYDFSKLYHLAQTAQRLMDDMIDLELECIDRIISKIKSDKGSKNINDTELELWINIRKKCEDGRRTGLGITVLGDTLAALGIKYGTEESIRTTGQIYQILKFGSYQSSCDMAKELGAFPIWDWELEKDNPFLNRIKNERIVVGYPRGDKNQSLTFENLCCYVLSGEDLYNDIKKYGRRNIANLTTAPTGTISSQAGMFVLEEWYHNTSSGIEPVYEIDVTRSKKGNPGDLNFRSDFVDNNGDHWMKFNIYHSGLKAWMAVAGETDITKSPYWEATAPKINWVNRVKLQAAAQRHVDHSISSTVNLPEDVTEEEVAEIYMEAWKSGLKGITVYRDNCRTGVLVDNNKASTKLDSERPKELEADVYHVTSKGTSYFVLVGLNKKGNPYEVFAGKNGFIDKNITKAKIIKVKKRCYKAIFEDETELAPITAASNEHEETITRLISGLLRSGASMHLIVQQLERINGDMHSFGRALSRVLKKYIPDGTKEKGEECPECNQRSIIRQDGCIKCSLCTWSKCS